MKLILSRKGFDSSSGGAPSPILPDGRLVSLPIPDGRSRIACGDIRRDEIDLGALVSDLTAGRIGATDGAHLDPDLLRESVPRRRGWRPLLGQAGAAQGHLRRCGTGPGDVFLFFGLFREVASVRGRFAWDRSARARHMLWGWLQVGEVVPVDACDRDRYAWAAYHLHFRREPDPGNVVYIAADALTLPGVGRTGLAGAGVFCRTHDRLRLTAPDAPSACLWLLPAWIDPAAGRPPLTYHARSERWRRSAQGTLLRAAGRGQEFVLDCVHYPESPAWVAALCGGA